MTGTEMTRRRFLRNSLATATAAGAAGALAPGAWATVAQAARERGLNVLFIMSDQHNARAMGCDGNPEIQTPNLDRLAQQGVRFSNAYCQTGQCCPSRYSIWTGRYAHSHGCRWNGVREPLDEITVGEVFKEAGYATATIGKHHMMNSPTLHGFDTVIDMPDYYRRMRELGVPGWLEKGQWMEEKISGPVGITDASNDEHPKGFWTDQTMDFLSRHTDDPFCLWYSFYGPHTPICPSMPWAEMHDPASLTLPGNFDYERETMPRQLEAARQNFRRFTVDMHRQVLGYYYGLVTQMDYNIGRVLDHLDALGLSDRTLVIYTSDHGEMMAEHGAWTKYALNLDATIRVPLIIRLPGNAHAGKTVDDLVGLIDLMPTLCDFAGLETPDAVQGRSLMPLIEGRPVEWRETVFSEIGYPGLGAGLSAMARTKTHKYVHHENAREPYEELFDLDADPWETRNEIANPQYAEVVAHLKGELQRWNETTDHAPMYPVEPQGGGQPARTPPPRGGEEASGASS